MQFVLRSGDSNIITFAQATEALGSEVKAHGAYRRAINHTGRKAMTRVRRKLAKQTGLTQKRLRTLGQPKDRAANYGSLEYQIIATGKPLSLKEFGAKQFGYGVRAKPWGKSRRFEGAFIFAGHYRSGKPVAGGHAFVRTSSRSLPIKRMYGPSIPNEMIEDAVTREFEDAALELPGRIAHEVGRLTDGVMSR